MEIDKQLKFKSQERMQVEFISNNVDVMIHDCLSSVALALDNKVNDLALFDRRLTECSLLNVIIDSVGVVKTFRSCRSAWLEMNCYCKVCPAAITSLLHFTSINSTKVTPQILNTISAFK